MKYYIIAGEASGDLHGSNLISALKKHDKSATFRGWGGNLMKAAGATIVKDYKKTAFIGYLEVILNIGTIIRNIKLCKTDILSYNPDVLIFIDYPGFNFKIAKWAKKKHYKTHYYISPKIWAWKEYRIRAVKRDIDFMYTIFPFETDFYEKKHNYPIYFVGNPLVDAVKNMPHISKESFIEKNNLDARPIIALLPGSRKNEIKNMLGVMLALRDDFPEYQFVVAGAPSWDKSVYLGFSNKDDLKIVFDQTYNLLNFSHAALVTSGTATLETAIFKVPQVVCYKGSQLSYIIARELIKRNNYISHISLVNIIMGKEVVKELIQHELTVNNLKKELQKIIGTSQKRQIILKHYDDLEKKLGTGSASEKLAKLIIENYDFKEVVN